MSDFKGVIALLCKVLHNLTSINMKPEYFRLAKFNKDNLECTEAFWQVLHKLCCLTVYHSDGCSDDRTHCIVKNVSRLGYKYSYRISADISGHQLLLILGWLVWNDILRTTINYQIYQSPLYWEFRSKDSNENTSHDTHNKIQPELHSRDNRMNYILYLAGKIRLNMKVMGVCYEDRARLCSKIHKASLNVSSLPHLSAHDVKLIKESSLVPDFMSKVEHCEQLLESYAKWKRKSYIFWEWMVSVLEEAKQFKANTNNIEEYEEELLKIYLKILKEEVRKTVISESKNKSLNIKSQRVACQRMIASSDDIKINKNIADIDLEIQKLAEECKEKEKEVHENLAKLISNRSDITVFKSKAQK